MARDVRFIVFNSEADHAAELRAHLLAIDGAKIVAEVDEAALLPQAIKQFPVDIALINLDPSPEAILPVIADAVESSPELAVFATSKSTDGQLILKVMRLGIREFLPKPIDSTTLAEAVRRVARQRGETKKQGKLITVTGASGGVGATVLATNLAAELAAITSGDVVVVDLDYRFGQVATLLDIEAKYTLADLCATPEQLETQVIDRVLVKHSSGVRVLSRPSSLAQADTLTAATCVGVLANLLEHHDYVVADGPTRSDINAKSVFDIADVSILLLQLLVPTVRNAVRIMDGLREGGFSLDRIRVVCNRVGRESQSLSVDNVAETLGVPVSASIADDWTVVSGAINLGETLQDHSPKSKARQAIREIAERLHSPNTDSDEKEEKKKGLIGRIFAGA